MYKRCYIELTSNCNLNCKHCLHVNGEQQYILDYDILCSAINYLYENGVRDIRLSGGEPLLYNKFEPLINHISNLKNLTWELITNATLINDEFLKIIKRSKNFSKLRISLDGATAKTHDFNRGIGTFKKIKKAFELIKKYRLNQKVVIQMVIAKYNYMEVDKFIKLAKYNNFDYNFLELLIRGNASKNSLMLKTNKDIEKSIKDQLKLKNIHFYDTCHIFCHLGQNDKDVNIYIDFEGKVYLCQKLREVNIPVGNIYSDKDVINQIKYNQFKKDLYEFQNNKKNCKNCYAIKYCGRGCYADYLIGEEKYYDSTSCDKRRSLILNRLKNLG